MTSRLIALAFFAASTASLPAGEPKLANATHLFPTSRPAYKRANQYHAFTMRLSPDAKRVLYTRPVGGGDQADEQSARYELVLRELAAGRETVLPVEPLERGWRTVLTRFNMFDPAGKRLALPNIKVETRQVNRNRAGVQARVSAVRVGVKWAIYDIAQGKAEGSEIEPGMGPTKFLADGQAVIVTMAAAGNLVTKIIPLKDPKTEPKSLTAPGWAQSVCPTAEVAVFFVPPNRPAVRPQPGERIERPPMRLVLWDLKADKLLAQMPTHPRNSVLDDMETQWTPDGRYLYYCDGEELPGDGQANRPRYREVARIWDRQERTPVGVVPDTIAVGPGPGRSLMVLGKRAGDSSGGFLLHDAATGKQYALGDASKKLIHAYGGKVLYAEKKPAGSDAEDVFSADLVVPQPQDERGQPGAK